MDACEVGAHDAIVLKPTHQRRLEAGQVRSAISVASFIHSFFFFATPRVADSFFFFAAGLAPIVVRRANLRSVGSVHGRMFYGLGQRGEALGREKLGASLHALAAVYVGGEVPDGED